MTFTYSPVYAVSTGAHDGTWNMAFDMSLFELFRTGGFQKRFGRGSMLWRFYSWHPPAVSLGYGQRAEEIDQEACRAKNIDIVRRPTGGRAVLHIDEFTYSLLADTRERNAEIYAMVHEIIRRALLTMNIHTEFCRTTPDMKQRYNSEESVSCFTASAKYELHAEGRKLVGSAQRRSDNVILQHGSLLLSDKHKMLPQFLRYDDERVLSNIAGDLDRKTVSVYEMTGYVPAFSTVRDAMIASISHNLKTEITFLDQQALSALF